MPGNLEALMILPERTYDVKERTLIPQRCLTSERPARRHQAGVKGAEGGVANP